MPVATGELVFNTAMSGYQEVITDPSYAGQVIAFTSTHIGNYGTNAADDEAVAPHCRGIVVCDLADEPSNWRATEGLEPFLRRHGIPALTGVDTRRLARHVRQAGAVPCAFGTAPEAELRAAAAAARRHRRPRPGVRRDDERGERPPATGAGTASGPAHRGLRLRRQDDHGAAAHHPRHRDGGAGRHGGRRRAGARARRRVPLQRPGRPRRPRRARRPPSPTWSGACRSSASASATSSWPPRWAGRPTSCPSGTTGPTIRCSAWRPASWRSRARTTTTPWPPAPSPTPRRPTCNLNDGVIEGFRSLTAPAFSVQYHPEAAPGPHDARYLFGAFRELMLAHPTRSAGAGSGRARAAESTHAASRRPAVDPGHRLRPDRDRPGLRVRLLGHAGLPGPGRGGLPGDPGQLQPGHHHDGPRHGGPDLHRAARPRGADRHHREGAAGRAAADPRRADRAEPHHAVGRARRPGALRRRGDRRATRGDLDRRGQGPFQGSHGGHRPRGAPFRLRPLARGGGGDRGRDRLPDHGAPELHPRRQGDGHRRGRDALRPPGGGRVGRQPCRPDPGGEVDRGLEGVRARGDARRRRQLRGRLLHRELRPHGRAHGRLHHGGPGADADRCRVPGDARRRLRLPAPGRGRDRWLQRAVRRRAARRVGGSSSR